MPPWTTNPSVPT